MDIMLSDEQRLLKDSVERFIADEYGFEQRKRWVEEGPGIRRPTIGPRLPSWAGWPCRCRKSMAVSADL